MFLHFQKGGIFRFQPIIFETFHQAWYQSCFMRCTASPVSQAYSKKSQTKKHKKYSRPPSFTPSGMQELWIRLGLMQWKACVFLVFIEGRRDHEDFTPSLLSISLLQEPRYQKLATRHVGPFLLYRRWVTSNLFSYIHGEFIPLVDTSTHVFYVTTGQAASNSAWYLGLTVPAQDTTVAPPTIPPPGLDWQPTSAWMVSPARPKSALGKPVDHPIQSQAITA